MGLFTKAGMTALALATLVLGIKSINTKQADASIPRQIIPLERVINQTELISRSQPASSNALEDLAQTPQVASSPDPYKQYPSYDQIMDMHGFSPYDQEIHNAVQGSILAEDLFRAQDKQESRNFDPKVVFGLERSHAGALGMPQGMEKTAAEYGFTAEDLKNPARAAVFQRVYMDDLDRATQKINFPHTLTNRERIIIDLAKYNAGPGNVDNALSIIRAAENAKTRVKINGKWVGTEGLRGYWQDNPEATLHAALKRVTGKHANETRDYIRIVMKNWKQYEDAKQSAAVNNAQEMLRALGYRISVDEKWGYDTQTALLDIQEKYDLREKQGKLGPQTYEAVRQVYEQQSGTPKRVMVNAMKTRQKYTRN